MSVGTTSYKLVLLGDSSVGKSSIVLKRTTGNFDPYTDSTIGAAFKALEMNDVEQNGVKYNLRFEIWDTAGQERYHSLAPMYYRNANTAIIVYDVTNKATYEKAVAWVKELRRSALEDIVIGLVGNKLDLVSEELGGDPSKRQVEYETASEYASTQNLRFWETSAKDGTNIEELFISVAQGLRLDKKQVRQTGVSLREAENAQPAQGPCTC